MHSGFVARLHSLFWLLVAIAKELSRTDHFTLYRYGGPDFCRKDCIKWV